MTTPCHVYQSQLISKCNPLPVDKKYVIVESQCQGIFFFRKCPPTAKLPRRELLLGPCLLVKVDHGQKDCPKECLSTRRRTKGSDKTKINRKMKGREKVMLANLSQEKLNKMKITLSSFSRAEAIFVSGKKVFYANKKPGQHYISGVESRHTTPSSLKLILASLPCRAPCTPLCSHLWSR